MGGPGPSTTRGGEDRKLCSRRGRSSMVAARRRIVVCGFHRILMAWRVSPPGRHRGIQSQTVSFSRPSSPLLKRDSGDTMRGHCVFIG